jgi:hypothetical protein
MKPLAEDRVAVLLDRMDDGFTLCPYLIGRRRPDSS